MEKIISSKRLTPLFALICAFLWGCGFSVTKTGYSLFAVGSVPDKILFAGIRFILAGVMTLICRISTGKIDLKAVRTSFTKIVLLSMFQTVFQYAFLYIALSELSGSVSSVLNQLGSFLLALLLPLADRNERMSAGKIAGCLLGFSGLLSGNRGDNHLFMFGCNRISSEPQALRIARSGHLDRVSAASWRNHPHSLRNSLRRTDFAAISGGDRNTALPRVFDSFRVCHLVCSPEIQSGQRSRGL